MMKPNPNLTESEYTRELREAQDQVQVLYNKIHYDRSATPELTAARQRLLQEAEQDLKQLKLTPYGTQKD
jgi:hypothetical protein